MMTRVLAIGVALLVMTTVGLAADKKVAVYLVQPTAPGEFQDPALLQRIASTRDLRERIKWAWRKDIVLVDRREDAAVVVEVIDRGPHVAEKIVRVQVTVGAYTTAIEGRSETSAYSEATWTLAAWDTAKQLGAFIRANHQKLKK
jgi:hypothetical protein